MLIAQLAIAVIVLGANLLPSLGNLISPSNAPDLTQPASPGDQTRRYTPRDLPARTPNPGSRPIPAQTDMPDRLAFVFTSWEGARALTLTGRIAEGDAGRFANALASRDAPTRQDIPAESAGAGRLQSHHSPAGIAGMKGTRFCNDVVFYKWAVRPLALP